VIDLEAQPDLLLDPRCDAAGIRCLGVGLGHAASTLPVERIVEVSFSPLVKTLKIDLGTAPVYTGFHEESVSPELAYTSVVHASGVLHSDADVSFTVRAGKIAKISLYGRWLSRYARLNTSDKVLECFGAPDLHCRLEAEGDLIAYDSYYTASKKWLRWLGATARLSSVVIGGDANELRVGAWGGVKRHAEHRPSRASS
jgi:hypothetical protein